jgi:hypothetical protein
MWLSVTPELRLSFLLAASASAIAAPAGRSDALRPVQPFLERYCVSCHSSAAKAGGLDIMALPLAIDDPSAFDRWATVLRRVGDGEMPPKGAPQPAPEPRTDFVKSMRLTLEAVSGERNQKIGRVLSRRLTRVEYENTVRDLLGVETPLKDLFPDDGRGREFNTVASEQQVSSFLLERYLAAADAALDEAFTRAFESPKPYSRKFTLKEISAPGWTGRLPEGRAHDAVAWSTDLPFVGRMPVTTAPERGWYKIRVRLAAVNAPEEGYIWATLRSGICGGTEVLLMSTAPAQDWIGSMKVTPEPREFEFTAWINKSHILEVRPVDRTIRWVPYTAVLRRQPFGYWENHGLPGIGIQAVQVERVYRGAAPDVLRERLFGDLPVTGGSSVSSKAPKQDLARLMKSFATRAFRRPVSDSDVAPYLKLAIQSLDKGQSFVEAIRIGYRSLLCSPRFLYFQEKPGPLDGWAIASRLSYLFWSTMPDHELLTLAAQDRLLDNAVLGKQVDRMLRDSRARAFTENFTSQWLNLRDIDFTAPDPVLYPEFDDLLKHSMLEETWMFFDELIRRNLSVRNLVDSDFTFLNGRLAKHYGIPGGNGDGMERVTLPAGSHRGGLLTQGSFLKVTANGTTTSPVTRGVWVSERILGQTVPPPPPNVPAVEPDIRGAKTIRDQLAKHRSLPSCAGCHTKIDPAGFALENYDPIGGWREQYRTMPADTPAGDLGPDVKWKPGPRVDASYDLADGKGFRDLEEFKKRLLADPAQLARAFAGQVLVYATGARISPGDRAGVDAIVARAKSQDFGVQSILRAVVESPIFLSK